MQIDHDPKELSHKAIKIVALVATALIAAIAIPVVFGVSWAVNGLPDVVVFLLFGTFLGLTVGFFVGRWDGLRTHRTPGRDG
ncbi:hypothetical protein J2T08_002975 [Neorhizobium galegae]|uniref:hypothetical protein n=1 Tax=Neorhizobium galegae TaxID=399 RepID=UPI002784111F|nr:hypothetical protein [Neorhizobium galegae]MDQ0135054.1 hypothetical protein [Neorhizobium galegae]